MTNRKNYSIIGLSKKGENMGYTGVINKINETVKNKATVYIMMHVDSDLDAMGSAIALSEYFMQRKKTCIIINDDKRMEMGVRRLYNNFKEKHIFKTSASQIKDINDDDILFILDTNTTRLISNLKFLEKFKTIINIDHHDKGDALINSEINLIDNDSSSTCEMLLELLTHLKDSNISPEVSTVLLSGIVLDTNSYSIKTTKKTFLSSAYLMERGADNTEVQYLLKQDLKDYIQRQKVISNAKKVGKVTISKGSPRVFYRREDLAKIADSLLLFNDIKASFVIARLTETEIGISSRSLGEINVAKILQNFGGGGDEEGAAAKIDSKSINDVYQALLEKIKEIR